MRADRLLQILLLLQTRGRMTAGDLADRLEVSVRTIQRDMDALSGAGVPVFATRGGDGGWQLLDGFRTTLTGLTPAEALAVAVGRPDTVLRDLGIDDAGETGPLKMMAALPALAKEAALHARDRIHVDLEPWAGPAEEALPALRALYDAASRDVCARVRYGDATTAFEIGPLGVVAKGPVWYCLALRSGRIRSYRVSRVRDVEVTATPFTRPAGFDLAREWREVCARLAGDRPSFAVRLRVDDAGLQRLRWSSIAVRDEGARRRDGWTDVDVDLENDDEASSSILALGEHVIVLRPRRLTRAVRAAALRLAANNR